MTLLGLITDVGIAVGPVYGYYQQYKLIKNNKNVGTFSIDVCAILLISNILRVFFWFSSGFATNLLFQSFFIIGIQIILLEICIRLNGGGNKIKNRNSQSTAISQQVQQSISKKTISSQTYSQQSFWRWRTFQQYTKFLVSFSVVILILTVIFRIFESTFYGVIIGFVSMSIQATLGLPQLIKNHQTKNIQGLSTTMIMTWFIGDFFKTIYFIVQNQPFQFTMCGSIQLTVDILIILQIISYGEKKSYQEVQPAEKS